jgi:hypothetical protein
MRQCWAAMGMLSWVHQQADPGRWMRTSHAAVHLLATACRASRSRSAASQLAMTRRRCCGRRGRRCARRPRSRSRRQSSSCARHCLRRRPACCSSCTGPQRRVGLVVSNTAADRPAQHTHSSPTYLAALPDSAWRLCVTSQSVSLQAFAARPMQVVERGLAFTRSFGSLLARQQRSGAAPLLLREAWAFAAHLSLAEAASKAQAARAEERRRTDHATRSVGRCVGAVCLQPSGHLCSLNLLGSACSPVWSALAALPVRFVSLTRSEAAM